MKSSLIIALLLFFVSCGKDEKLRVIHNNDRVTDLERRVTLLEQIVQTKADTQTLQDLSTFVNSQLTQLSAELAVIQSDYLTSEDADELIELGEAAYQDLLSKINALRSRVASLENDPRLDEVIQALEDLQQEVADIEPVINNDNSVTYEVTEVVFNFGNLFTYIDNSVTNITQDSTDLTDIIARLDDLESNTFQAQIDSLESQLTGLKSQVEALQNNSGPPSVSGVCSVKKTQDYGSQKDYVFKLNDPTGLVGDFKVVINMSNNSGNITTNNGGPVTFSGGVSTITPINSATQFTLYSHGNSNQHVNSAKVVKISTNQELTCTVDNSI